MPRAHEMIEVNLHEPDSTASSSIGAHMPDDGTLDTPQHQQLMAWTPYLQDDAKPRIRFFAVGPTTYQICCPLCKQRADAETVQMSGILGELSCLLSLLSCCFPIFWLSCVYCTLQRRLKSKRLFCSKCGGYVGYFVRPT